MLRRVLIAAALLAGLLAPPAAAQIGEHALLMPGVTYDREVEFTPHGPVVLHVITAPKPDGSLYQLAPVLSNDAVVATDRLTAMEKSLSTQATVAGVNGDYFESNPGDPSGIVIRNSVLDSPPLAGRSSIGVGADGTVQAARVAFSGIWKGTGQRRPLTLNRPPAAGPVTLYTSAWGPATPPEQNVVADVIPSLPPTRPNADLIGTVSQAATAGGVAIPPGGAVLVARGGQAPILARDAPAGTTVFLRLSLTPDWSGLAGAIGGGPVLVQGGKPIFRAKEAFGPGLLNPRAARSAVGQLADGRILLVTTDGGTAGYSVGMTNFELALALVRLGAVTACALGSGQPASMSFDGSLLSRPAGLGEAPIADALALLYTGVYIPAFDPVISPNGDGVEETLALTYKVVHPSTVTATISGDGGRQVLETGLQQPGLHTFTFDGKRSDGSALPEGGYRFSVVATDDTGRTSSAQRPFALNDTLGALATSPPLVRITGTRHAVLAVTFTLARPATVTATVETRSGIVVRTLNSTTLPGGPQKLLWDGRTAAGTRAFDGAYLVRVRADNAIGHVELTQPFTARRG
ncbi:MAG: FlgD immunoglobulin-like domain containing protein [Gaiellaceae bacterium]